MIWKWIIGAVAALAIGYLAITYIPGVKFWEKQRTTALASRDSLERQRKATDKLAKDFADFKVQIERDKQRSDDQSASVLPNIKLDVADLTLLAQRQANLENLIRSKLLTPADTAKQTPTVSYNEASNKAITIKLRLFDSLNIQQVYTERANTLLNQVVRGQTDTIRRTKDWIRDGKAIARKKGWFTGRNRELRQHNLNTPF